jgi:hypothetical protein
MVADEDIRCAAFDPVAITDLVGNEIQYTINARPAFDKKMGYDHSTWPKDGRDQKTREEEDHECRKNEEHPYDIELTKERAEQVTR